ncbi:uncharacterized protein YjbI with pentapeptide repeats [Bradyrhizobium yuanmingense]|uniref:Uncharacterized protein YjbI with pentapeptide repeats n=1 Tax=Bradyrhizobium yuanmingense TaxID=108015 RepID=A0ABV4GA24_9BRAD|nr:pentapeptide repeat-containing protein [Bradyrhizobium yuanmingense]
MDFATILGVEMPLALLLVLIASYVLLALGAIIFIPRFVVPPRDSLSLDDSGKLLDQRMKVRSSVIQVVGGITVIATFIYGLHEFRRKEEGYQHTKAQQFAKSVAKLTSDTEKPGGKVEAIYVLGNTARRDPTYHRAVFEVMTGFIQQSPRTDCDTEASKKAGWKPSVEVRTAMRVIGERDPRKDITGKRLNLEESCLSGLDLSDEWGIVKGLSGIRFSSSSLLRIDFTKVELEKADLSGITAGDRHNADWSPEIGRRLHSGEEDDPRLVPLDFKLRRGFVAHFVNSNLSGATFHGAGLEGADFSGAVLDGASFKGANISRANFNGSTVKPEQLLEACVGNIGQSQDELRTEQPYVWRDVRKGLGAGVPACL